MIFAIFGVCLPYFAGGGVSDSVGGQVFRKSNPLARFLAGNCAGKPIVQERKISPKRKFSGRTSRGHPGVIRADIPAQNFGQGGQNPGNKSISAQTSMTRRRGRPRPEGISKNFGQKNFGLNCRSLIVWVPI